jgi:hypothetical protein
VDKDFDAALSEAIDLGAGAARPAGAAAARGRGRERTIRKRIALTGMSFVLVAAGSATAFTLSSPRRGATVEHPAVTSHPTPTPAVSPTPGTAASPTPATPANPTDAGSATGPDAPLTPATPTTPDTPETSTPSTPVTPTTSATSTPTPSGTSAPSTATSSPWLTPKQVPFQNLMNWSAKTPVHCTGSMVFNANYPGDCASHSSPGTAGAAQKLDVVVFASVGVPTGNGAWSRPMADQDFYTYANAADASAAFQSITSGLLAEDPQFDKAVDPNTRIPINSTTIMSAQGVDTMAIDQQVRDVVGNPAEMPGEFSSASDVHYYFVLKNNILEVLEVRGGVSISDTSGDNVILSMVSAH